MVRPAYQIRDGYSLLDKRLRIGKLVYEGGAMGFFSDEDPEPVTVQGKPMRCQVCQNDRFGQRKAQLHSGFATFLKVEWASPTCTCVICSSCGYVHWFLPEG